MTQSELPPTAPLWMRVSEVTGWASEAAGGDKVCAAVSVGVTHSARFSEYSSFEHPTRLVRLDNAIRVDAQNLSNAKPAYFLNFAAQELGFLVVKKPVGEFATCTLTALCAIMTETAEAVGATTAALSDQNVCSVEASELRSKLADVMSAVAAMDAHLAEIERGKGE